MTPTLLLIPIAASAANVKVSTVCDCTKPRINGLIDTQIPDYFTRDQPVQPKTRELTYKLMTSTREEVTWKGYSCSIWTHTKRIIGSFWAGSFDTTFSQTSILISEHACWTLSGNKNAMGDP